MTGFLFFFFFIFFFFMDCFLTLLKVSFHPSHFNSVFQVGFLIGHINEVAFDILLINQFLLTKFFYLEFEKTGWVLNEFLDSRIRNSLRDVWNKNKKRRKEIKKQLWSCHKWGVAFIYFFVIESEAGKGSSLKYVISNLKFTEF